MLLVAALIGGAIVVQVVYARAYGSHATRPAKVVWGVNIALLVALLIALVWFALRQGAG